MKNSRICAFGLILSLFSISLNAGGIGQRSHPLASILSWEYDAKLKINSIESRLSNPANDERTQEDLLNKKRSFLTSGILD